MVKFLLILRSRKWNIFIIFYNLPISPSFLSKFRTWTLHDVCVHIPFRHAFLCNAWLWFEIAWISYCIQYILTWNDHRVLEYAQYKPTWIYNVFDKACNQKASHQYGVYNGFQNWLNAKFCNRTRSNWKNRSNLSWDQVFCVQRYSRNHLPKVQTHPWRKSIHFLHALQKSNLCQNLSILNLTQKQLPW